MNRAKKNLTKEEANKLLATGNEGRTFRHVAAEFCLPDLFQQILNWAKYNLTTLEENKLFLTTDNG
jgi:hypothetical protein